MSGGRW